MTAAQPHAHPPNDIDTLAFDFDVADQASTIASPDRMMVAIRQELLATIDQCIDFAALGADDVRVPEITLDLGAFDDPPDWDVVRQKLQDDLLSALAPYLRHPAHQGIATAPAGTDQPTAQAISSKILRLRLTGQPDPDTAALRTAIADLSDQDVRALARQMHPSSQQSVSPHDIGALRTALFQDIMSPAEGQAAALSSIAQVRLTLTGDPNPAPQDVLTALEALSETGLATIIARLAIQKKLADLPRNDVISAVANVLAADTAATLGTDASIRPQKVRTHDILKHITFTDTNVIGQQSSASVAPVDQTEISKFNILFSALLSEDEVDNLLNDTIPPDAEYLSAAIASLADAPNPDTAKRAALAALLQRVPVDIDAARAATPTPQQPPDLTLARLFVALGDTPRMAARRVIDLNLPTVPPEATDDPPRNQEQFASATAETTLDDQAPKIDPNASRTDPAHSTRIQPGTDGASGSQDTQTAGRESTPTGDASSAKTNDPVADTLTDAANNPHTIRSSGRAPTEPDNTDAVTAPSDSQRQATVRQTAIHPETENPAKTKDTADDHTRQVTAETNNTPAPIHDTPAGTTPSSTTSARGHAARADQNPMHDTPPTRGENAPDSPPLDRADASKMTDNVSKTAAERNSRSDDTDTRQTENKQNTSQRQDENTVADNRQNEDVPTDEATTTLKPAQDTPPGHPSDEDTAGVDAASRPHKDTETTDSRVRLKRVVAASTSGTLPKTDHTGDNRSVDITANPKMSREAGKNHGQNSSDDDHIGSTPDPDQKKTAIAEPSRQHAEDPSAYTATPQDHHRTTPDARSGQQSGNQPEQPPVGQDHKETRPADASHGTPQNPAEDQTSHQTGSGQPVQHRPPEHPVSSKTGAPTQQNGSGQTDDQSHKPDVVETTQAAAAQPTQPQQLSQDQPTVAETEALLDRLLSDMLPSSHTDTKATLGLLAAVLGGDTAGQDHAATTFWAAALHAASTAAADVRTSANALTTTFANNLLDTRQDRTRALRNAIARLNYNATGTDAVLQQAKSTLEAMLAPTDTAPMHPTPDASLRYDTQTAGLILFHPYIAMLFDRLGIDRDHNGILPQALGTGRSALDHLIHGDTLPDLPADTLQKCLLGLPPDGPSPERTPLDREATDLIDSLISSVISQWGKLGNTSADGLRAAFVQRGGVLQFESDERHMLTVNSGPYDMLLDALPWAINMVSLPWMAAPLFVDWRDRDD